MRKITIMLLTASFFLMVIGIYRNETATVLNKGINICLECVGIG